MTTTFEVLQRAARKEAEDAVTIIESEIAEANTSQDADALRRLAVDLEQQFAKVSQQAAERAEWLTKIENRRQA